MIVFRTSLPNAVWRGALAPVETPDEHRAELYTATSDLLERNFFLPSISSCHSECCPGHIRWRIDTVQANVFGHN
ncbi:MAG: hypothetical protein DWH84_05305 [Planctomycetota bacterium]|nr:MAG: hypothetical protein DWH84_05305 [Planctomycetota bacterium]